MSIKWMQMRCGGEAGGLDCPVTVSGFNTNGSTTITITGHLLQLGMVLDMTLTIINLVLIITPTINVGCHHVATF